MTERATLTQVPELFALRVPEKAALGEPLPTRVRFLKWGRNDTTKGPFILDAQAAALLPLNQRALGFERVALDYEHNTVPGTVEFERSQEPRPVAAHGAVVVVPQDGLYLEALTWTPSGQQHARNYEDLSGALAKDDQDRVIFVHSVGLTHNGATPDVHLLSSRQPIQAENTPMPETIETLTATVAALSTQLTGLVDRLARLETKPAPAAPDLTPLSSRIEVLEQRLTASASAAEAAEREALVAAASREGKVIPLSAESVKRVDVATLRELVAGLPKNVVPLRATAKPAPGAQGATLTGAARAGAAWNDLQK